MPTGRQIRAARGLLGWSADRLAESSGLARQTITLIEGGGDYTEQTMGKLSDAFDREGIVFLKGEGVQFREIDMRGFTGVESYRTMLEHIHSVMKENKGGRLYQIASDAKYLAYAGDYVQTYLAKMEEIPNLDSRTLTQEGDDYFPVSYCKYRWLPKGLIKIPPFCVYGNHVVLPVRENENNMELASIHSKLLADRYAEQFLAFWSESSTPKTKKSKIKN